MRFAVIVVLVSVLCGCVITQKSALVQARKSYAEKDYNACVSGVESALIDGEFVEEISSELMFYKGLCLESAGRASEAIVFYKRAIDKYPDTDSALQAAVRLKKLAPAQ
jgi:TolA-binding protein